MNTIKQTAIDRMNLLGTKGIPFVFLIDFDFDQPLIVDFDDASRLLWQTPEYKNYEPKEYPAKTMEWTIDPVDYANYEKAFLKVQEHIQMGDTYLLNLTMPTRIQANFELEEVFYASRAPYKLWLKDQFVCFSPEIFVRIKDGVISSYPMKGTIDATIENAAHQLLNDEKEVAEHHTIVDLIRNDMSTIASDVTVKRLMYLDRIHTNRGDLLQMSSQITGKLPLDYHSQIGSLIARMLPAGSICGAPKPKTVEIIKTVEPYQRGYYTGVFGIFDGKNLDSCVLIRYLEQSEGNLVFKSGGGITFLSDCALEYNELIQKVYVPIG
jgi:para-aminobenzoate synthetase component 1